MAERRPPWYQREPFPSVVRVLLDHGLIDEGGTASLRLAARLVEADTPADGTSDSVRAVIEQLDEEGLAEWSVEWPEGTGPTWAAAQDIVDVLVEHRATDQHTPPAADVAPGATGGGA